MGVAGRHIVYLGAAIMFGAPAVAASAPPSSPQGPIAFLGETRAAEGDGGANARHAETTGPAHATLGEGVVEVIAPPHVASERAAASLPLDQHDPGAAEPLTVAGVEVDATPRQRHGPLKFRSERDAFRSGIRDYYSGDKAGAVRALEYAAQLGHSPAQWKLGRMYAEGDGVGHDDLKAFEYFSRVIQGGEEGGGRRARRFISNAYVALGGYYLDGIDGTYVNKDERRARDMFQHAASYFGDPDAQYNLARLCLAGQGGPRNAQLAARWLHLAAEKRHAPSQALLGHLLLTGQDNVKQHTPRGLMWLTIARNAADPVKDAWIIEMYDEAVALVSERERKMAQAYLDQRASK